MSLRSLAVAMACLLVVPVARADAPSGFVGVRGAELTLDGAPFRFLGANASVIHGPRERAGYEAVLDAAVADGLRVVRVWALGEQPAPGAAHHPLYAFRIGEAGWVDESFVHLDRVVAAASARGLKLIVVLANRWKDYGGIATYLSWAGASIARDERGEPVGSAQAAFFGCARCQELYREHVARIVSRVNGVTGVPYRDEPAIMAWELINEASGVSAGEAEALLAWVASTARLIRSLDPHHLIAAGHIGYQTTREQKVWEEVERLPEVDYADAHLYPQTDVRVPAEAAPRRVLGALVGALAARARVLHKPLVIGEFGFERERRGPPRERWVRDFTEAARAAGVAGALIWLYEPPDAVLRSHTLRAGEGDAGSRAVRAALRRGAEQLLRPQGTAEGFTLGRLPTPSAIRGSAQVHRARGATLLIPPEAFARARFERFGVYDGHALRTVWGEGEGELSYRFAGPPGVPSALRVEARVSSELPGAGNGRDPRDGSDIAISVDGFELGIVRAMPDDGLGELVRVELVDPFVLRRLFRAARVHTLRFRALPSAYAGGLCVYGAATGKLAVPAGRIRPLTAVRIGFSAMPAPP